MTGTRERSTTVAIASITRRRLLQSSGVAVAGLIAAPWLRSEAVWAQSATPVPVVGTSAWDDLAGRLSGHLLRPDDAMYPAAAIINAARYQGTRPEGIAGCASPEDAAVCVTWARENGVPFAVRSGGHSYAGFSTSDGLVIEVKVMRSVSVDPANRRLRSRVAPTTRTSVTRWRPTASIFRGTLPNGGRVRAHTGWGWGFSCRHLGMTCDNLLSTELVTADGAIVTVSETENPDLFWAGRGASGDNFGVHTSFTFQVVAASEVTVFSLTWSGGDTASLVDAISRMQVNGPRELGLRVAVRSQSRMQLTQPAPLDIDLIGLYWGPRDDVDDLLAPVERIQSADTRTVVAMGSPAARAFLAATTPTGTYGIKTEFVTGTLAVEGMVTMLEWIATMPGFPSRTQESTAGLYCWGGKVNDLAPDTNAFVHRGPDLLFKFEALWEPEDDPDLIAANLEWLEGYHAAMQPHLSGGAYQNFTDRAQSDWHHAYYGANFERLVEIKRRWDQDNLFRFGQSVPVSL